MLGLRHFARLNPDFLVLQAEQAGRALACSYSSSDEFEAALIAERREAGVYGPKWHRKQMLATVAAFVAVLAAIVFLIF